MQALQENLINDNWIFIFPNMSDIRIINIFDEEHEIYTEYNNKWVIFGEYEDKVALFNYYNRDILIKSIGKYKISRYY